MEDNELKHFGVVGMKWGVRKNPSRAYGKASKKANKLNRKAAIAFNKTNKANKKTESNPSNQQYINKAAKKQSTYERKQAKADKWISSMEKTFRKTNVSDITQKDMIAGKDYAYMLRAR